MYTLLKINLKRKALLDRSPSPGTNLDLLQLSPLDEKLTYKIQDIISGKDQCQRFHLYEFLANSTKRSFESERNNYILYETWQWYENEIQKFAGGSFIIDMDLNMLRSSDEDRYCKFKNRYPHGPIVTCARLETLIAKVTFIDRIHQIFRTLTI